MSQSALSRHNSRVETPCQQRKAQTDAPGRAQAPKGEVPGQGPALALASTLGSNSYGEEAVDPMSPRDLLLRGH